MKKIFLILMATLCPILTIAQGGGENYLAYRKHGISAKFLW